MQLFYGGYGFPFNAVDLGSTTETIFNEANAPYKIRRTVSAKGYLSVSGQADAILKESALRTALAIPWLEVAFLSDDGLPTPLSMPNLLDLVGYTLLTAVRVKNLRFPMTRGPEYVTIRSFEVEFEAEFALPKLVGFPPNPLQGLLSFTESLSFEGGMPIFRHRLAIEGPNQKQLVYPQDTFRAVQQGQAVGTFVAPVMPAPIWPEAMKEAPKIVRTSPHLQGLVFQGYAVTWHYEFEDVEPLIGVPHLWPI